MGYRTEVLADSPTAYWRLGESSGTAAADEQAAHAGTYVNTPTLGVAGAVDDGNTAITLNGTNQRVATTTLGTLGANIATSSWECWINTTSTDTIRSVFGTTTTGSSSLVNLSINTTTPAGVETGTAGSTAFFVRGTNGWITTNIYDGAWHHIVVVIESTTTFSVYVDGVARTVTYGVQTALTAANFDFALALGCRNQRGVFERFFPGSLDEVAVYPSRLSSARVAAHYAARVVTGGGRLLLLGVG